MKRIISVALFLAATLSYSQNLQDSLLIFYTMNGNCTDASGNGFDAAIINATLTQDRFGVADRAYHFDGSGQYIQWPFHSKLQPQLPVSAAFWVKFDNANYYYGSIFNSNFTENKYSGIFMGLSGDGKMQISYGDGFGGTDPTYRRTKRGTTVFQSGIWYHVIGVIKGPMDMEIYVNCENDGGTYSGTGGPLAYTANPGALGKLDSNPAGSPIYFLHGVLDDFRFWNREITWSEVSKICSLTSIPEENSENFRIFPNPAGDILNFSGLPDDACDLEVIAVTGATVLKNHVSEQIYVGALNQGYYMVRLFDHTGSLITVRSFVK